MQVMAGWPWLGPSCADQPALSLRELCSVRCRVTRAIYVYLRSMKNTAPEIGAQALGSSEQGIIHHFDGECFSSIM